MDEFDGNKARIDIARARKALVDVCHEGGRLVMSVPARETDADLVIATALESAVQAVEQVELLRDRVAVLERVKAAAEARIADLQDSDGFSEDFAARDEWEAALEAAKEANHG